MAGAWNTRGGADPFASAAEQAEHAQLLDYWGLLVRRRAVVLTSVVVVVSATLLLTLLSTPIYEASTTIEIERQSPEILEFTDVLGADPAAYKDFYQTQYKILQSRSVTRLAAEGLDLVNRPDFAQRKTSPLRSALRRLGSRGAPGDGSAGPHEAAIRFIERELRIAPVRKSHLVEIVFRDRDPALAAEVANQVAEAYQEFQAEARYQTTRTAKEFLASDVALVRREIDELERALQKYAVEKGILGIEHGSRDVSEQALGDLNVRYTATLTKRDAADARHRSLLYQPADAFPEVLRSDTVGHLRQRQAELERRYVQMAEKFNADWPPLVELGQELLKAREQFETEKTRIADQVRAAARADLAQTTRELENLRGSRDTLMAEVQRVNREAVEYESLQAEIETKRRVLADLVMRQSESETSYRLKDTGASNIRVVDRAEVPDEPAYPRKLPNLLLALLVGLSVGVGAAFLVDHLDNTVKNEADVARVTSLPVLARIPLTQALRLVGVRPPDRETTGQLDLASHLDPRSNFAETFRTLRTSLLLAVPDQPPRFVAVTSCEPGDGKSTVALNLAIVLTQLGRRVLLVDADLRRPRLHKACGLENREGLSSFLSGNAPLASLVRDTAVPNLRVITSGPVPPNPSELVGSPGLQALLDHFAEEDPFDHVLFDSPPVLSVTDAVLLASRTDSTLLVVRAGQTTREGLAQSVGRLRQSRAHVMGSVLNAVPDRGGYYGRYSRYHQRAEDEEPSGAGAVGPPQRGRRAG